ncbi:hypothetical protein GCM10009802_12840 [Streptomyces synnematoformans]|uniref:Uncharacterized protein n=1 Tax=Streptomyces synnematoformans TaxID=415721 RepID=A0ABN2XN29_9ACTN
MADRVIGMPVWAVVLDRASARGDPVEDGVHAGRGGVVQDAGQEPCAGVGGLAGKAPPPTGCGSRPRLTTDCIAFPIGTRTGICRISVSSTCGFWWPAER